METIHIATAIDNNYAQHVGVMLCSLFENNPKESFVIHLLHRAVEENVLQAIRKLTERYHQNLRPIEVSLSDTDCFVTSGHITVAAYLRIFVPQFVTVPEIHKVLYLDGDIIVKKSISALWNIDIKEYLLAATEDVTLRRQEALGYAPSFKYFNSGVLLINLDKWREQNIMQKTLGFVKENPDKLMFHDQDALNAVLYNDWLPLHSKYNMQAPLFMEEFEKYYGNPDELEEAILDPVIIHYSAPLKPWHYLSFHPYTQEYYKYLSLTPWKGFEPKDKNMVRVVRKYVRPFFKRMGITKILGKNLY